MPKMNADGTMLDALLAGSMPLVPEHDRKRRNPEHD